MTPSPRPPRVPTAAAATALSDAERDELQELLDRVPPPLEALDVAMLDGYLCGVLVQPQPVPAARWLAHVTDADGRPLPGHFDARRLHALAQRRHAELDRAIGARQWFDPWVFELEAEPASPAPEADADGFDEDDFDPDASQAVYPWVAGFATALELFPALLRAGTPSALTEPLALLYRHLDPDDLEDADDLIETIDSLEPPADLAEAVEGLVRATLLLADVGRPVPKGSVPRSVHSARRGSRKPSGSRR
ncbi:MAG: YecA family protein [Burkholderiaceae bacterium]